MTYTVTLVFEDGRSTRIPAEENETIYLSALKKRIRLETDCREGACATCKGLCTDGSYYMDDHVDEALTEEEAAQREVLTCQMHPTSDCVIELPYEAALAMRDDPETVPGTVNAVEMVSSTVARLLVDIELDADTRNFMAGQYVHLSVPGGGDHRSYSFANPPEADGPLEFYVKLLESGAMSDYLRDRVQPGDEMAVTGPFGRFYLRPPERPILMVAGGTGLAPMLSMLDRMVAAGQADQSVHLLYGVNDEAEQFGADRIAAAIDAGLSVEQEIAVVAPSGDWDGPTGHVTDLLRPDLLNGGDVDVYLCGPPPMIDAAEAWLAENGVDRARIHAEKFLPS